MIKKSIIAVSVISICAVSYSFYYSDKNNSEIKTASNISVVPVKIEKSKHKAKQAATEIRKKINTEPQVQQHSEKKAASHLDDRMFASSERAEEVLKGSGKLRNDLEGEVYLEINAAELLGLNTGDTFRLDIPELNMLYDIEVKNAYQDQFGNKTIEAQMPDQDKVYGSVITLNARAIYANVTTPAGIYVMQGNGQYAWMAETNDLSKEAVMDPM